MRKRAERQIVIEAPPQACFEALTDHESFPDWQRAVRSTDVLSRDRDGRGEEVAFEIDAGGRTIRYTLAYRYEAPHLVAWRYVEGDVQDLDGEFVLEDRGDGTTLATCALRLDGGMWVPGPVSQLLSDHVMQGAMEDLKRRVESG
jgi:uncharacterized protein YndB with AHSA1/START domain